MKKCYCRLIFVFSLLYLGGCQADNGENAYQIDLNGVEETMNSSIKVDPAIDLSSGETISVIIEFKTKPAKIAVLEAEAQGVDMTLDKAKEHVEQSHQAFEQELHAFLDDNEVEYRINHRYKTAFNGVSIELPANEIKKLMGSSVISRIYPNQEIQLDPPIQPSDQM
ncbi:protease inhibitor I9 family protein [Rossellomorea aquimaris]|uniref:protease inhibitor I9 family protein n=1 Tax=Rossellomorea aquimaris TaxID=189382 RepID=UPI0005CADBCF|nr:protease inhibitor I9 family protein [Rossellomorea aquimaris]